MEGGTGVYYQAMPAVGPDGKNVMKLIPVQKVNGQFYQTSFNTDRDNVDLQLKAYAKPLHSPTASSSQTQPRLPSLQATADGRYVLKTLPEVRTLSNPVRTLQGGTNNLIIHSPKQMHVPPPAHSVSQYTVQLSPQPSPKSMMAVQSLPVTVKSPVLPNGHFLEIPPNAKVRTMPATALPQSIKCRILNSVNNISNLDKTPPTVVLVSPVNSVKLNFDQEVVSLPKQSQVQKTLSQNPPSNRQTPVCVPKTNEVKTPIKWVIQEGTGASARCLIPASPQNVNSDSVKTATHVNSNEITASKPTLPQTILEKITPGKDNALVMCNGKVYFVARKNSEIAKDVLISEGEKQGVVSVSPALPASSALASNSSKPDPKISISEVIDLCDDDEETSTCLGGAPGNLPTPSQTEADESDEESNVIFVSYIPPKSSAKAANSDSQKACEEHAEVSRKSATRMKGENVAHAEVDSDSGIDNLSDVMMDELVKENDVAERNLSFVSERVNMEEEKEVVNERSLEARCQDEAVVIEYARVLEQPQNLCNQTTENIEKAFENPAPVQSLQPKSDSELIKEFGITSYVQICLQKQKPTVTSDQQKERLIINKRTLDGLRKVIQESKLQSKIQQMIQAPHTTEQDEVLKAKRQKQEQEWTEDTPFLSSTKTLHISKCSDTPMESSLVSKACQEEVCSPSESAANKDHMRSEMAADVSGSTCCLTPSLKQKAPQTASHLFSLFPARNVPPRVKKGKMCTACPCGTILGASKSTSSQEKTNPCTDSHKGTKTIYLNKPPGENCQPQKHQPIDPVKMSGKKPSSKSPLKDFAPLESSISKASLLVSSVNVTSSAAASSVSKNQTAEPPSVQTEISNGWSRNTNAETSQQNTGQSETSSNYTSMPLSKNYLGPKMDKFPMQELYSLETLDAEEIKRRERIKRLKDLLKEKEAALERMQSMNI